MIQANGLRIGNVLSNNIIVESIGSEGINIYVDTEGYLLPEYQFYELQPIPLTEDILLRCGFTENNSKTHEKEIGYNIFKAEPSKHIYIRTACDENIKGFFTVFNHSECNKEQIQYINTVKYLHQLQNLYFILTGEELLLQP